MYHKLSNQERKSLINRCCRESDGKGVLSMGSLWKADMITVIVIVK